MKIGRFSVVGCQLVLALTAGATAWGGIFPEKLGTVDRTGAPRSNAPRDPVYEEYGFEAGEQADYGPTGIIAWRFKDATGAMAAFQYLRPLDARPFDLDKLAAVAGHLIITAHGNYLFQIVDGVLTKPQYAQLLGGLPKLEQSALPVVSSYLPPGGLTANSERYITGPVSLEKFLPGIPPSVAAFHMSAEAQYGRYGSMNLAIFAYPTPSIARDRAEAFQKLAGMVVKRTGSMVVLTVNPPDADAAERILAKVNYQAQITWNEKTPGQEVQSFGRMMLSIFKLAGVVLSFCLLSGLAFAGIRILSRKLRGGDDSDRMLTLHLGPK